MLLVLSFNSKISKTILAQKDSPNTSLRLNQLVYFVDLYLKISKTILDQTSGPQKTPILKIQKPAFFKIHRRYIFKNEPKILKSIPWS